MSADARAVAGSPARQRRMPGRTPSLAVNAYTMTSALGAGRAAHREAIAPAGPACAATISPRSLSRPG